MSADTVRGRASEGALVQGGARPGRRLSRKGSAEGEYGAGESEAGAQGGGFQGGVGGGVYEAGVRGGVQGGGFSGRGLAVGVRGGGRRGGAFRVRGRRARARLGQCIRRGWSERPRLRAPEDRGLGVAPPAPAHDPLNRDSCEGRLGVGGGWGSRAEAAGGRGRRRRGCRTEVPFSDRGGSRAFLLAAERSGARGSIRPLRRWRRRWRTRGTARQGVVHRGRRGGRRPSGRPYTRVGDRHE